MVRILIIICGVALVFICAGKFTSQANARRTVQSDDYLWKIFSQCEIRTNQNNSYSISYLPGVKAMNGKRLTISGFIQPLEATEKFSHYLLSSRAPTCAFCPPGEPNEIVEVFSAEPVRWEETLVTVKGTLILANDSKKGIFFQLKDAR